MNGRAAALLIRRPHARRVWSTSSLPSPAQAAAASPVSIARRSIVVRPQDDLFRHVNGGWLATTEIPPERVDRTRRRPSWPTRPKPTSARSSKSSPLSRTAARDRRRSRSAISTPASWTRRASKRLARRRSQPRSTESTRSDDTRSSRRRPGTAPVDRHARVRSCGFVVRRSPRPSRTVDAAPDAGRHAAARSRLLPARRSEVRRDSRRIPGVSDAMFTLAGRPERVHAMRRPCSRSKPRSRGLSGRRVESRDALNDLQQRSPLERPRAADAGLRLDGVGAAAGHRPRHDVVIAQPSFFKGFAAMVPATPISTWKAWLAARHLTSARRRSSASAFDDARFEFFGRALSGQEAPRTRWRRGVSLVNTYLGEALGRLYVERHFPTGARESRWSAGRRICSRPTGRRSPKLDWMTPQTKTRSARQARAVDARRSAIPIAWRDYRGLVISADDLARQHRARQAVRERLPDRAWLGRPVEPRRVADDAADGQRLLQPGEERDRVSRPRSCSRRSSSRDADDAVNYGAIGAVIGHEIGHAFDDRGATSTATARLRDWWTPARRTRSSEARAGARRAVQRLQSAARLAGERRADARREHRRPRRAVDRLSGLEDLARGQPAPVIDGLTGDQRFFMGWAQVWRAKEREGYLRQMTLTDPHRPASIRANGPSEQHRRVLRRVRRQARRQALLEPAKRVKIW